MEKELTKKTKSKKTTKKEFKRTKSTYNISDYVDWRGDLSFEQSEFNEVDNLILSRLVSFDFNGIVAPPKEKSEITLKEASDLFFEKFDSEEIKVGIFSRDEQILLLKSCAQSRRFSEIKLTDFISQTDEQEEKQFGAMRFIMPGKLEYIAFRGTDDTLVGWKEDLKMSYIFPVPSQSAAAEYFNGLKPTALNADIMLGGHSKGGNLAVYAATKAPKSIQKKIVKIYSNDGPGFEKAFFDTDEFKAISSKIVSIVPHSSMIGMLMEHASEPVVVKSRKSGPMQHDAFTWLVEGCCFLKEKQVSESSLYWDRTITAWLNATTIEQRKEFIDFFFDLLYSTNSKTLSELTQRSLTNIAKIIGEMKNEEPETKEMAKKVINLLIKECADGYLKRSKGAK